jgi:hypothetical protein
MSSDCRAARRRAARAKAKDASRHASETAAREKRHGAPSDAAGLSPLEPREDWGTMSAVAKTPGAVPDARRVTHDSLVEQMGDRRTGAVRWLQWTGPEAEKVAREAWAGDGLDDLWRPILEHLATWPRAVLVMALAPGRRR